MNDIRCCLAGMEGLRHLFVALHYLVENLHNGLIAMSANWIWVLFTVLWVLVVFAALYFLTVKYLNSSGTVLYGIG
jgi:hypothetical protein